MVVVIVVVMLGNGWVVVVWVRVGVAVVFVVVAVVAVVWWWWCDGCGDRHRVCVHVGSHLRSFWVHLRSVSLLLRLQCSS